MNWRSARPWANRRAAESRHYNGCVIIAGAQLRNLCAFHRFVLDVTVERTAKSAERVLSVAVHPDGPSQGGLPALPRFTGMHARDCAPTAADGISPRPSFAWPSPKNVWFFTAANSIESPRDQSISCHKPSRITDNSSPTTRNHQKTRAHSSSPGLSSRVKPCARRRTASRLRGLTPAAIPVFWLPYLRRPYSPSHGCGRALCRT